MLILALMFSKWFVSGLIPVQPIQLLPSDGAAALPKVKSQTGLFLYGFVNRKMKELWNRTA